MYFFIRDKNKLNIIINNVAVNITAPSNFDKPRCIYHVLREKSLPMDKWNLLNVTEAPSQKYL